MMRNNPRHGIAASLLLILLVMASPLFASFSASVDRTTIAAHETFELSLRVDDDSSHSPDLTSLEKNFDILGTRQSRQVRIINGSAESWREWIVTLSPKRKGSLVIPEIPLGKERSNPITMTIQDGAQNQGAVAGISPVFMRAELDNEQIYTQQQAVLTLKIFHRVSLYDDSRLTPLEIEDAIIQQLGETKKYESVIEGSRYGIFELKFAIYPQKSGSLTIPSMTFSGTMADRRDPFGGVFSMGGKPIVARSPEILLSVKEPPADYPASSTWLPAKKLTLKEDWSQPVDSIKIGDAVTRTITIEAEGLNAAQLPPLLLPSPAGVNSYPDQSSTEDTPTATGITGKRISAIAMVPTTAGKIELPPVDVTWYDTEHSITRHASIPARTLNVLPVENYELIQPFKAAAVPENTEESTSTSNEATAISEEKEVISSNYWKWIAIAMAGLWLLTVFIFVIWLLSKRKPKTQKTESSLKTRRIKPAKSKEAEAYQQLESACHKGENPAIILEALKNWGRAFLNNPELKTLDQCVNRLGSDTLKTLCTQMDSDLYSNQPSQVTGAELLAECKRVKQAYKKEDAEDLAELYPG